MSLRDKDQTPDLCRYLRVSPPANIRSASGAEEYFLECYERKKRTLETPIAPMLLNRADFNLDVDLDSGRGA
jgi:hypothetical protein